MSPRKQITYSQRPNRAARAAHARGDKQFRTYDTSHILPKRSKAPGIIAAIAAVVIVVAIALVTLFAVRGCSSVELLAEGEAVEITFEEGTSAQAFAEALAEARLVESASAFVSRASELGATGSLIPGTYTFEGGMSLDEIIEMLLSGPGLIGTALTIPEGFTLSQTASRVEEVTEGRVSADEFTQAASNASVYAADYPFLAEAGEASLEGFLFPKTYDVPDDATADSIIRMMLDQYETETSNLDYSYPTEAGLSNYEMLILASIVEKEATDSTRATVASVFYNRLANSMRLQSDATTAYVIGNDPTADDIANDTSGYSTYQNDGLPVGPICSPSLASLQAVCAPETTDYFYFYFEADENGELRYTFSRTNEEHNAAIFG